jgi:16S rRNA (guanine527-N7)-methyltransferase
VKHQSAGGRRERELAALLSSLARRYGLDAEAEAQLGSLLETIAEDPLAPTTVRDRFRALDDHLADSLVALELDQVRRATLIADLGAGVGVPGLPLAIALPAASVSLVDSNARNCEFIARAIESCGLSNATVVNARAEAWTEGLERFDLVTARALASLAVVAEYAAPLLRIGGALLAWRGRRDPADEASARLAAGELGLEMLGALRVEPYQAAANRHLQLMVKTAATPARFPRRPGMARKRPLGAPPRASSDR